MPPPFRGCSVTISVTIEPELSRASRLQRARHSACDARDARYWRFLIPHHRRSGARTSLHSQQFRRPPAASLPLRICLLATIHLTIYLGIITFVNGSVACHAKTHSRGAAGGRTRCVELHASSLGQTRDMSGSRD
jgi:hypothetical protein